MKRTRKIFALLLSICMIVTMLPTVAFAVVTADNLKIQSVQIGTNEAETVKVGEGLDESESTPVELTPLEKNEIPYSDAASPTVDIKLGFLSAANKATVTAVQNDAQPDTSSGYTDGVTGTVSNESVTLTGVKLKASTGTETSNTIYLKVATSDKTVYYKLTVKMKGCETADLESVKIKDVPVKETLKAIEKTEASKVNLNDAAKYSSVSLTYTQASESSSKNKIAATASTASKGAQVTAGTISVTDLSNVDLSSITDRTSDTASIATGKEAQVVWFAVKVVSGDTKTTKYYVIKANIAAAETGTDLISVKVKGQNATLPQAKITDAASVDLTNSRYYGTVKLTHAQAADTTTDQFLAELSDENAKPSAKFFTDNDDTVNGIGLENALSSVDIKGKFSGGGTVATAKASINTKGNEAETRWLIVEVTAEDGTSKQYYVFKVTIEGASAGATLDSATIKGELATLGKPISSDNAESANLSKESGNVGSVPLSFEQASDKTLPAIEYELADDSAGATVTAGVKTSNALNDGQSGNKLTDAGETFKDSKEVLTTADEDTYAWIVIKVVSEDTKLTQYYVIKADVSRQVIEPSAGENEVSGVEGIESEQLVTASAKTVTLGEGEETLKAIVTDIVKKEEKTKYNEEKATELLETNDIEVTDKVYIHAIARMVVKALDYSEKHDEYKLDIKPVYRVVASTEKDVKQLQVKNDEGVAKPNAVEMQEEVELPVDPGTEISVTLPTDFAVSNVDAQNPVYVVHQGTIQKITSNKGSGKIAFASNGFSEYDILANNPTVATVTDAEGNSTDYLSLQEAVNAAIDAGKSKASIKLLQKPEPATVNGEIEITLEKSFEDETYDLDDALVAGEGYVKTKDEETGAYVFTASDDEEGNGEGGTNRNHKVTVADGITNGTVTVDNTNEVAEDTVVTVTVKPAEGYELDQLTIKTDGGAVPRDEGENGTYTFKMPAADVTVSATFKVIGTETEDTICKPYTDVDSSKDSWYHDDVHYMIENGLMTGVAADKFAPNMKLNRAMVTQILYAKANKPTDFTASKTFSDVEKDQWYTNAVLWAAEKGAVTGYTDGTFKPLQDVTRQELAVMLYGIEGQPAVTDNGELKAFTDAASIADWAQNGMLWAVQSDIMDGDNNKALNPTKTATRAEAAVMLHEHFAK